MIRSPLIIFTGLSGSIPMYYLSRGAGDWSRFDTELLARLTAT